MQDPDQSKDADTATKVQKVIDYDEEKEAANKRN